MSNDSIMTDNEMIIRLDMMLNLITPEEVTEKDEIAWRRWKSLTEKEKQNFVRSTCKDKQGVKE